MPAAQLPDAPRYKGPRLVRFGVIGLTATFLYATLALLLERVPGLHPVEASTLAYAVAGGASYFGHKLVTFVSHGEHRREVPRFIATTLAGFAIATATPAVLTHVLALPSGAAIAFVCVAVPIVNFLVLDRWVFVESTGR